MFPLSYLFPLCSILKLSFCTFFLLANTHLPPIPPSSLPHLSSLSHNALLFSISLSFLFPSITLPPSSYSSLSPHLLSSINVSTSLSILLPISLSHSSIFPPNPSFSLPLHPSILLLPYLSFLLASSPFAPFAFSVIPREGHFQICVHELRPLSGHAAGPEPQ